MAAAAINSVAGYGFPPPVSSSSSIRCSSPSPLLPPPSNQEEEQKKQKSRAALVVHTPSSSSSRRRRRDWSLPFSFDHSDIIPLQTSEPTDAQPSLLLERDWEDHGLIDSASASNQVAGFAFQGGDVAGFSSTSSTAVTSLEENRDGGGGGGGGGGQDDLDKIVDRTINATVALAAGTFAITKLLTIDHDYWHGWTLFEILRYAPQHNWTAYEEALKTNPVLAKMMISGIVYSLGDWIAQCYEGKPLFEIDRARIFRSSLVGFTLHGSLSHYYYHYCEALFPVTAWWVVLAKAAFDQTVWAAIWNSIYFVVLGFLRFESPATIYRELRAIFWPMLTAGWKLWPFAHLITYGVVPVEQRLLWVDCVELIWVTILSTYSNEKSETRNSELVSETDATS